MASFEAEAFEITAEVNELVLMSNELMVELLGMPEGAAAAVMAMPIACEDAFVVEDEFRMGKTRKRELGQFVEDNQDPSRRRWHF